MSHHGNAGIEDFAHGVEDFHPAFQFHGVASRFLHDANRVAHAFYRVYLIRSKGHVAHYEGALHAAHHTACVVYHLIECNGQGCVVACHDIRGAVAYEDNVHSGFVHNLSGGIVIRCKHGDFLALLLHFFQAVRGDFPRIVN